MTVSEAVGRALVRAGVDQVFGVVGSGNFHVTNAMVAQGARFVAARHEAGATTMADAYARMSGRVAAVTVHQGCGLTNAMTGLAEAAKSRTPLVVVAAEATEPRSNFHVDQPALARAVGALSLRVDSAEEAVARAGRGRHARGDHPPYRPAEPAVVGAGAGRGLDRLDPRAWRLDPTSTWRLDSRAVRPHRRRCRARLR